MPGFKPSSVCHHHNIVDCLTFFFHYHKLSIKARYLKVMFLLKSLTPPDFSHLYFGEFGEYVDYTARRALWTLWKVGNFGLPLQITVAVLCAEQKYWIFLQLPVKPVGLSVWLSQIDFEWSITSSAKHATAIWDDADHEMPIFFFVSPHTHHGEVLWHAWAHHPVTVYTSCYTVRMPWERQLFFSLYKIYLPAAVARRFLCQWQVVFFWGLGAVIMDEERLIRGVEEYSVPLHPIVST